MSTVLEKPKSISSRFSGFRPSPRLVRGVDLAGQWAAPIMCVVVLIVAAIFAPAFLPADQPENRADPDCRAGGGGGRANDGAAGALDRPVGQRRAGAGRGDRGADPGGQFAVDRVHRGIRSRRAGGPGEWFSDHQAPGAAVYCYVWHAGLCAGRAPGLHQGAGQRHGPANPACDQLPANWPGAGSA